MAEIRLHGIDIDFDKDRELCFDLDTERHWFYLTEADTMQLRDFLNAQMPPQSDRGTEHGT